MALKSQETYQSADGLERAVIDLIRVGGTGFSAGVRQLATRLIKSVPSSVNDKDSFREAVHEAITNSIQESAIQPTRGEIPLNENSTNALIQINPEPNGGGLTLRNEVMSQLNEIVNERLRRNELTSQGVSLTRTVLFNGLPGVGKTMAAHWIAENTSLPLVSLDLSEVVSSYLGNSGRNIKSVMEYAQTGPCVLLLDEFDALAKKRDDEADIGELKRIVNVLLVEMERWTDVSLLIAATNHLHLLDPAVGRRFDRIIEFPLPSEKERNEILSNLTSTKRRVSPSVLSFVALATEDKTGSDLIQIWNTCMRRSILNETNVEEELIREIAFSQSVTQGAMRDKLWALLSEKLGYSNRQIAAQAGVSHPTVSAALKRTKNK